MMYMYMYRRDMYMYMYRRAHGPGHEGQVGDHLTATRLAPPVGEGSNPKI